MFTYADLIDEMMDLYWYYSFARYNTYYDMAHDDSIYRMY